ncbi:MAG: C39 family peptidase [Chloroflexi bacterium]|nr:C39 family peptidase [Chloroflexota bacterium]
MLNKKLAATILLAIGIGAIALFKYDSIRWRIELVRGAILDLAAPAGDTLPTALPSVAAETVSPPLSVVAEFNSPPVAATPIPTVTATSIPISLVTPPESVTLKSPKWEKQDINNCGPATLAMYLRFYGWQGTQDEVAKVVHPNQRDKNVRWDEMVYYVKTHAGWLDALFRVGGTVDKLKLFLANGYPVVIETGYEVEQGWVGHYLLITGYDDSEEIFIVQDVTAGPDRRVPYETVDQQWQEFNRLYIVVFPPDDIEVINALLGPDVDETVNRQNALAAARTDTQTEPENAFAWFNLGSNLNYFDRYAEAAEAFDKARELGLPKRMLFYQFGPYRAYFNLGRYQDVIDLSTFTLDYRPDLEESYFWRAWAEYMLGDKNAAIADFRNALEVNPTFNDAKVALESIGVKP